MLRPLYERKLITSSASFQRLGEPGRDDDSQAFPLLGEAHHVLARGTGDSRRSIDWQLAYNLRVTRPELDRPPTANQAANSLSRGRPPARPGPAPQPSPLSGTEWQMRLLPLQSCHP
jgi:hypothetical protein